MFFLLLTLFCLVFNLADCAFAADALKQNLRIGIAVSAPPWEAGNFFRDTARHLQWKLPQFRFDVEFLYPEEIRQHLHTQKLDFVICSPLLLGALNKPSMRVLATIISRNDKNPDKAAGASVLVKKNSPFHSLEQLRGQRISATATDDFSSFIPIQAEIASVLNSDPNTFFSEVYFEGITEGRRVLRRLLNDEVQAAIVRSGYLDERSQASGEHLQNDLRVLPIKSQNTSNLPTSTVIQATSRLYPNEVFVATPSASNEAVRTVLAVLLSKPINSWGQYWSVAPDMTEVTELLKTLKIGPYDYMRHWSWQRIWTQYRWHLTLVALVFAFLLLHGALAEWQVKKRTQQLEKALEVQKATQDKLFFLNTKVEGLERSGIVSQLSTIIAHEVKHHLAGIVHLNFTLRRKLDEVLCLAEPTSQTLIELTEGLEEIDRQAHKATEIIDHVRKYAKRRSEQTQTLDLGSLVGQVSNDFILVRRWKYPIEEHYEPECFIQAKRVEIEILVLNLLKNATEAAVCSQKPQVSIEVKRVTEGILLSIRNNGERISADQLELMQSFSGISTKQSGLGLGLGIIRTLAEGMFARIKISAPDEGGAVFEIRFPFAPGSDNTEGEL